MMEREFPYVNLIETNEDLGWAGGNNRGIQVSRGKYLFLLNSDILVVENSFDEMVSFMERNPRVGMVAPKLLDGEGESWTTASSAPGLFMVFLSFCVPRFFFSPRIKKFIVKSPLRRFLGQDINKYFSIPSLEHPSEVEVVGGASVLIRRKVIEEIGLPDENFFSYSDDIDLSFRVRKGGW